MYNIKFTKISNNVNKLRTIETLGFCHELPKVNERFTMWSEGIDFGIRLIQTSVVQEVTDTTFKTTNSEYKVELINNVPVAHLDRA